jgi:hypothetical protein
MIGSKNKARKRMSNKYFKIMSLEKILGKLLKSSRVVIILRIITKNKKNQLLRNNLNNFQQPACKNKKNYKKY